MPKPWKDVAASPEYQALPADQQAVARDQYFSQVVAPQISDPAQVQAAKAQFDAQYGGQNQSAQPQVMPTMTVTASRMDDPTGGMSTLDKARAGLGKAFVDVGRVGLRQLGQAALDPFGIQQAVNQGAAAQAEQLRQEQADANQRDAPLMHTGAGMAGNIAGQVALAATPVGDLGIAGKAGALARSALSGGIYAAAQPVVDGESRLANVVQGAAAGAVGHGIASGISRAAQAIRPALSDATQRGIQVLRDAGVPLHFSQLTDSKFAKTLASAASYLPFSGSGAAKEAQQAGFNRALARTIDQDATKLTPDVMQKASDAISKQYDDLFARNNVTIEPTDVSRLVGLAKQAAADLTPENAKVVQNQIGKYINAAADNDGAIPGRLYQNIRAELLKLEAQQPAGHLVSQVRKTMQDVASKSFGPDDAAALQTLNGKYSNLQILKKALTRVSGADDNVNPAQLWSLVNGKYGATPEMRALAQAGQNVLKDPIPDSGTAARGLVYSALGLGGALHPAGIGQLAGLTATGATLGRALNSQAAARLLPGAGSKLLGGAARLMRPAPVVVPAVVRAEKQK
jgi:hypothetical protein